MATTLRTWSGLISMMAAVVAASTGATVVKRSRCRAGPLWSPVATTGSKLTTTGLSRLWVVHDGTASEMAFDPRSLGLERCRQAVDDGNATATLERWTNHSLAFR